MQRTKRILKKYIKLIKLLLLIFTHTHTSTIEVNERRGYNRQVIFLPPYPVYVSDAKPGIGWRFITSSWDNFIILAQDSPEVETPAYFSFYYRVPRVERHRLHILPNNVLETSSFIQISFELTFTGNNVVIGLFESLEVSFH